MRSAVVERQLIMQGLNFISLARLASTCRQLRGEAMHKDAGKYIPVSANSREYYDSRIPHPGVNESRRAHLSPLFRKHMPMTLSINIYKTGAPLDLRDVGPLLRKADQFARITRMLVPSEGTYDETIVWSEARILRLLNRPCIQRVERITLDAASWMTHPRVQAALFALPCLKSLKVTEGPPPLKAEIVQARTLTSLDLSVMPEHARLLRPIRYAPALTALELSTDARKVAIGVPFADVVWCLPSTLQHLSLGSFDVSEAAASRSLLKAMFLRLRSLQSFSVWGMQAASLIQGMLDAGVRSLPRLRRVTFNSFKGAIEPALLRRFLHRFPAVEVHLSFHDTGRTFGGRPRVKLDKDVAENDGPPVANTDDDVDGPIVESAVDPGSDEEQ